MNPKLTGADIDRAAQAVGAALPDAKTRGPVSSQFADELGNAVLDSKFAGLTVLKGLKDVSEGANPAGILAGIFGFGIAVGRELERNTLGINAKPANELLN
jgi:hypothetical protein